MTLSHAVPSALEGLTTVFEMGTGVAPPLSPPQFLGIITAVMTHIRLFVATGVATLQ